MLHQFHMRRLLFLVHLLSMNMLGEEVREARVRRGHVSQRQLLPGGQSVPDGPPWGCARWRRPSQVAKRASRPCPTKGPLTANRPSSHKADSFQSPPLLFPAAAPLHPLASMRPPPAICLALLLFFGGELPL